MQGGGITQTLSGNYTPNPRSAATQTQDSTHAHDTLSRVFSKQQYTINAHDNACCTGNGPCNVPGCAHAAGHGQCEHRQEREEEVQVQRRWCKRATTGGRLGATALIVTTCPHLSALVSRATGSRSSSNCRSSQLPGMNTRGAPSASTTLSVACCVTQVLSCRALCKVRRRCRQHSTDTHTQP